jgi:hypothetical protein
VDADDTVTRRRQALHESGGVVDGGDDIAPRVDLARSGEYAFGHGGFVEQSSKSGATATLTFTGVSVSVIGARGPGLGSASIEIDGTSKGTPQRGRHLQPRRDHGGSALEL